MKMNFIDRAISVVSPAMAVKRVVARTQLNVLGTFNSGGMSNSPRYYDTAHEGASNTRRAMRNWTPWWSKNADDEVLLERYELVARSRDAYRNQPIAKSAIDTAILNVVGEGLVMHSRLDAEYLGIEDKQAEDWQRNVERLFNAWANSTDADAARKNTFYRLQWMAFRSARVNGEIFGLLPLIPRKNTICNLRVQLVESDRVSSPYGRDGIIAEGGTYQVWHGIETGKYSEPEAYWIETTVPRPFGEGPQSWQRMLAYGSKTGRRQVLHFYDEERIGQRRGIPALSPILELLKQVDRYREAEMAAAAIAACFTVFVKRSDSDADVLAEMSPVGVQVPTSSTDDREKIIMGSGTVLDLEPGEDIVTANPGRPNPTFGPFMSEIIKQISMGTGIPYEVLTKQFTASYSASRAAIMQAWEFFKVERSWFVGAFVQPIYEEWLAEMIANKKIAAPGYFEEVQIQRAYSKAEWYGPVPMQIDPLKEANAATRRMDSLVTTLSEETAKQGGDWIENLRQRKREQNMVKELGLELVVPTPIVDAPIFEP